MPRSKEFSEDLVLSRAMEMFWEKGYESTSVQDLVDCMGINRFSIYSTFGDKEGLFLAALDRYGATVVEQRVQEMEDGHGGRAAIENYFARLVDCYGRPGGWRGCFMINCAVELGSLEASSASERILAHTLRVEAALENAIEVASERGEITSSRPSGDLAGFLLNQVFGLGVLAKVQPDMETLRARVETALSVLDEPARAEA